MAQGAARDASIPVSHPPCAPRHVRLYEDPATLASALRVVPVALLHRRAVAHTAAQPSFADALLLELLRWFRQDFFKWITSPPCDHCGSADVAGRGGAAPSTPEELAGLAGVVELYSCRSCGTTTRFPRYNHPAKLLTWVRTRAGEGKSKQSPKAPPLLLLLLLFCQRKGRCGEWANCFTLCCLALGFDARHTTVSVTASCAPDSDSLRPLLSHCPLPPSSPFFAGLDGPRLDRGVVAGAGPLDPPRPLRDCL